MNKNIKIKNIGKHIGNYKHHINLYNLQYYFNSTNISILIFLINFYHII